MHSPASLAAADLRRAGAPSPLPLVSLALGLFLACGIASRAGAQPPPITFHTNVDYAVGQDPWPIEVADLNGDGHLDIVTGNELTSTASVLLGTGLGTFGATVDYFTGGLAPRGTALGHLNGDGVPDLVLANYLGNSLSVLFGTGTGGFGAATVYAVGTGAYDVDAADIDGQNGDDVVVASAASATVSVFVNDGSGQLVSQGPLSLSSGSWPVAVEIVDIDGDGRLDVITANYATSSIAVFPRLASGAYGAPTYVATGTNPWGMYVADLNHDGLPDIVTANSGSSSASVLINAGNRVFAAAVHYPTYANTPTSVTGADFNFDGHIDVVVGLLGASNVVVLPGLGDGTFGTLRAAQATSGQHGVATGDFNRDGRVDLACTLPGPDKVAVLLNNVDIPLTVTTTPNPSSPGETVTISAFVALLAHGRVDIYDDDEYLGQEVLIAGAASMEYDGFELGANQLKVVYSGDVTHPRDSITVVHYVKVPSSVEASSQPNPTVATQPLELIATVTPATAVGPVRFFADGIQVGVAMADEGVARLPLDSLSLGVHLILASFDGDAALFASSDTVTHVVNPVVPHIVSVRDVPADQGGRVFVTWRFYLDRPPFEIVTGYRVWRRVPPAMAAALRETSAPGRVERFVTRTAAGGTDESFWEAIADLPAARLQSYGYTAATTRDSTAGGNPLTAFFVQALTAQPFVYHNSQPDSGYSVDNLAPAQPQPFVGVYSGAGVTLHWLHNDEADLAGYRLHRGASADFVPGEGNLVTAQPDTGYHDAQGSYASYYKLAAVDVHGNRSPFALVTPDLPTPTIVSIQNVTVSPGRVTLVWLAADGRQVSIYRRTPDEGWRQLGERAPDGENRIRFEDDGVAPGRYGYRIGIQRGDGETFAGEVWVDVPRFDLALEVAPNPATALPLGVRFTLPAAGDAEIRLFDVSGRLVDGREVGGLGPGAHVLALAPREGLRPGVYLIQLRFGTETRLRRVVLMR